LRHTSAFLVVGNRKARSTTSSAQSGGTRAILLVDVAYAHAICVSLRSREPLSS
jgi:hypothetical protein